MSISSQASSRKDSRSVKLMAAEISRRVKANHNQSDLEKTVFNLISQRWDFYGKKADLADYIKFTLNDIYGTNWHCLIGKDFGFSISHEDDLYFSEFINGHQVVVFKSG